MNRIKLSQSLTKIKLHAHRYTFMNHWEYETIIIMKIQNVNVMVWKNNKSNRITVKEII